MKPGRELDALVAEKVMGWTLEGDCRNYYGRWEDADGAYMAPCDYIDQWSPSTEISATEQVWEKMECEGWYPTMEQLEFKSVGGPVAYKGRFWYVVFDKYVEYDDDESLIPASASEENLKYAVCLAALRAKGVKV